MKHAFQTLGARIRTVAAFVSSIMAVLAMMKPGLADDPLRNQSQNPRVLVLTDIGPKPDPDDAESLVRLLLYSNELDIEGLVASTAAMRWHGVHPDYILRTLEAYEKVHSNLLTHDPSYPMADHLREMVKRGNPKSGLRAVGIDQDSEGSDWLIARVDANDPRPLWVLAWGGTNVLAQALTKVSRDREAGEVEKFVANLRVFAVSDQDDTGPWLRQNFPELFLIASPGGYTETPPLWATFMSVVTKGRRYSKSTPAGFGKNYEGADNDIISKEWLRDNVMKGHGPLGEMYPPPRFHMEGDTPSFLYLVPNGLGEPERPHWGSWAGRYLKKGTIYTDTSDRVVGLDGQTYISNHASVWRWRRAYQYDFAARMDWTIKTYAEANHPPVPVLAHPDLVHVTTGDAVELNAAGSYDPDGDAFDFRWFHYPEPGGCSGALSIRQPTSEIAHINIPTDSTCTDIHVVLEITDQGTPPLTRYRRVRLVSRGQ